MRQGLARLDVVTIGLFARGGLILCYPGLYDSELFKHHLPRVLGLGLVTIWLVVLFVAHLDHEETDRPWWFKADLVLHITYAALMSKDVQGPIDPVIFGSAVTAACFSEKRLDRRLAVVAPGLVFAAGIGLQGSTGGVILAVAQTGVAWWVADVIIPHIVLTERLTKTIDESPRKADADVAEWVAAAAARVESILEEWAKPGDERDSPDNVSRTRSEISGVTHEASAANRRRADWIRAEPEPLAAPPRSPGLLARAMVEIGGRLPSRLREPVARFVALRGWQDRQRELVLQRALLEQLFVVALAVRVGLLGTGVALNGLTPAFVAFLVWSVVIGVGWFAVRPFLAEDGWRLLTALDLAIALAVMLLTPSEAIWAALPIAASSVALAAVRGYRRGLLAAMVAYLTLLLALVGAEHGLEGSLWSRALLLLLLWGLAGGAAASILLRQARIRQSSGREAALDGSRLSHDTKLRSSNLILKDLASMESREGSVPLARRQGILLAHKRFSKEQWELVHGDGSRVPGLFCVNDALEQWLTPLQSRMRATDRQITFEFGAAQPLLSRFDAWRLGEVASELVTNAIVHTDDDPIIVTSRREGSWWVFQASGVHPAFHRDGIGFGLQEARLRARRFGGRVDTCPPWALRVPLVRLWEAPEAQPDAAQLGTEIPPARSETH